MTTFKPTGDSAEFRNLPVIAVPAEYRRQLEELAGATGSTISFHVRLAIRDYLYNLGDE